jgi:hypothetical protein
MTKNASRRLQQSASTMRYREATVADVAEIARSRLADPAAGRADPRMAAYLCWTDIRTL